MSGGRNLPMRPGEATARRVASARQRVVVLTFPDADAATDWEQLGGPFSIPSRWRIGVEGLTDPNGCDVRGCNESATTHRSGGALDLILCAEHDQLARSAPTAWRTLPAAPLPVALRREAAS